MRDNSNYTDQGYRTDLVKCHSQDFSIYKLEDNLKIKKSLSSETEIKQGMSNNIFKQILFDTFELQSNDIEDKHKKSLWKRFKSKVSNFKNNVKYNMLTLNSSFDYYYFDYIRIFDSTFITKTDTNRFCSYVYLVICMTYRSEFQSVEDTQGNSYSSDCGWGCMIRSAQMQLANGIKQIKMHRLKQMNNFFNDKDELELIIETVMLFLDNPLTYEDVEDNPDYINMCKNYLREASLCFKETLQSKVIKSIQPPFGIKNISKAAINYSKNPGHWFSDVEMINIFTKLNEEFKPIENLKIISFHGGVIYNKELREALFELNQETSTENDHTEVRNPTIVYVSVRLGLEKISSEYLKRIPEIFYFNNNIGIIGGRTNTSHYFIGYSENYLLYFDPHLNQKSLHSLEDLRKTYSSYLNKQIYQMPIHEMSPAFTVGFVIKNYEDYSKFKQQMTNYTKRDYPCFKFLEENIILEVPDDDQDDF